MLALYTITLASVVLCTSTTTPERPQPTPTHLPSIHTPTMAPSTPKKSHQKKKKRRAEVIAADRQKRQDVKSTPTRKSKQHPIAVITQMDHCGPSDASSLTPCFTPSPSVAHSTPSNVGIDSLINRKGHVGNTKPVEITETNILGWFRDTADAPMTGNSESLRRGARHLFQTVLYSSGTTNDTSRRTSSSDSRSVDQPTQHHNNIPVGGVCPIRRLILEDICILPAYSGLVCILCVGSGYHLFEEVLYHQVDNPSSHGPCFPFLCFCLFVIVCIPIFLISQPHLIQKLD